MRWILAVMMGLAVTGCGGTYWAKQKGDALVGQQRDQAEDLLHVANIAYKFRDYPTAYQYYQRVITAWPKSRYATEARQKIVKMDKQEGLGLDTSRPWEASSSFGLEVP